jgi:dCMP deaminase
VRGLPSAAAGGRRRPDKQTYNLLLAVAARSRADCLDRRVGAIITRDDRVLSTGYTGTPFGMPNCSQGGCARCAAGPLDGAPLTGGYDVCLCVHAEQNAILHASRFGQQTLGASMTSTLQPCFGCLKEMLQAGIEEVRFLHYRRTGDAYDDRELEVQYLALQSRFRVFDQVGDESADSEDLFASFTGS